MKPSKQSYSKKQLEILLGAKVLVLNKAVQILEMATLYDIH